MTYIDDLKNELKKRKIPYGSANADTKETAPESFTSQFHTELKKRGIQLPSEQDRNQSPKLSDDEKYPLFTGTGSQVAEETIQEQSSWFKGSSAFDDGYQFGDISKMILGTTLDATTDLTAGVLGILEGTIDAGAYLIGGAAKLFGADEFADNVGDFIQKDIIDEKKIASFGSLTQWLLGGDEAVEGYSVLGDKSDGLVQSAGQMVGTMGLQAVGVPWYVTSGVTSFGGQVEQALGEGASYGEAGASALVSAGAEVLSEKLFGGSGLGEKGLINTEALTKGIANKAIKALADFGVDVVSEGAEEVVSEFFSNLGTALYKEENIGQILGSEEALQGYLDSFIGGAALGGVMNAAKVVKSVKNETDYRNGMTAGEQKVFDKTYNDAVTEAQKDGKTLSKKEKAAVYDKVMDDLKKGYLSPESIEKALGGEAYDNYKNLVAESEEFNELYDKPYEKMSQKQRDRLAELTEKNKAKSYEDAITEAYEALKKQVTDDGKSFRESYEERNRRTQAFQADVAQYDEKYRSTIQNAFDSGILNNTNRSHEFVDLVAKISADTGTAFDFANNAKLKESGYAIDGKTVNGIVTPEGIVVNTDSAKALNTVVGHEVTHILEGTELYDGLKDALFKYAKGKGEFFPRRAELAELYDGIEGADIDGELVADLAGDYLFTDESFIRELSTAHRNVFQKLFDEIKRLCKLATAGSKEARELEKVKQTFEKVYREAGQATKNTADGGGVKYSITEIVGNSGTEYGIGVRLDSDLLTGLTDAERKQMVKLRVVEELAGNSFVAYDNGTPVEISIAQKNDKIKADNGRKRPVLKELYDKYNEVKIKQEAVVLTDELVETSKYEGTEAAHHSHDWLDNNGKNNWDSRTVFIQDKNSTVWKAVLQIANSTDGRKILYDIQPIKMVEGASKLAPTTTNNSISNSSENVNNKYSLSDSQGRQLSNDQAEYFRNAKTVDENGNLKPFYHGTARADRVGYYFDPERATSGPMAYFTDNRKIADNYAKDKADTSLAYDEVYDDYYSQFRMNVNGTEMSVSEAWKQLPYAKRNEIREKAKHITMDDDYSSVIYDENAKCGPGGLDAYTINAHKGNVLEALTDAWLESGTIYGEEQMFLDVLKLAGLENVQYMDPDFRAEKTYEVYLNITNPFDASNISAEMVEKLKAAAENAEYEMGNSADMWDKRNIEPAEWIERLEQDIENGTTHVWTSIPDFVTDVLKANGYDGIFDKGGKNGGEIHTVAIPFYSEQIKDIDNRTPTVNPDIRYSLSPEGEGGGGESGGYNVYGEDIRRLDWNDLAPETETGPLTGDDIAPTMEGIARQEAEKVKSQAPGDLEAQLEAAKQAYEDAARESDILFDKYNKGEITDQEFQSRYKEMERRLLALENQRDYLQNEVDQKARADSYTDEDVPLDPKWKRKTATDTNQTKATKPVAESKPIIAKKELRSTIMDLFSTADGTKNEIGSVIDSYADRLLKKGSLTEADRRAFFERMYESGMVTVAADEYYQQARQYIKGGRIYVDQNTILELGDNWSNIRRKAFAAGVYLTSDSRYRNAGIDVWNHELATELPGLFSAEDTDLRSILENIVRVAEEGKAQKMSLAEYTESLTGRGTATEAEIMDHLEREMDQALRAFAEKAKLEIKLRDRTGVKIAQERQARAEAQQRARARKELSELQQKTLKSLQWLNKNRNRAPQELKAKYDEVLSDIDIYAVGAANEMRWSSKYEATYRDLAQIYQDAKTSDPNFLPSKELEKIVARLNNRKIADMDIDALNDLYKAATALRTEFYNRNNVINDDMHRLFSEVYGESKTKIENAPGKYSGKMLDKLFNLDQLTPMNVLQRMVGWDPNSTFYSMAKQLERGARDVRAYKVKAARQLETFLTENKDLVSRMDGQGKNAIWYEIEVPELSQLRMGDKPIFGKTVTIKFTPSQKIHMYLESKNADNLRHMTGGRTFADPELYSQGKRQEAFAQGTTVRLAPETVKQIVSDLTPKELELAGIFEKYYNVFAKEEINKVSNPLYGYDKAMGNYYAPIVSNQNYTQTEFGEFDVKAENVGHLKGRNYSKNPSYNIGCFDAFERHVDQTARFVGMAIPTRNWQALMNWQSGGKSTADVITHKWGQEGKKYITDLITDLQGGKMETTESVSSGVSKLESNYISAVFGANPSIVMKQLGSIPLAGTYLGMNNFPSVSQIKNIDTDLIGIYTPDLQWRTMGYSMPETKTLKESQNWTQKNKVVEFTMGGGAITAMDGWAASTLWPWAENKVRREHPELEIGTSEQIQKGESPFYKAVAAEFENAVARSQSTSEDIYQSTLRKSKNVFAKAFTMFRSDSAQTYNAIRQKIGEYKYYAKQGDTAAAKKAKSCIGTAMATAIGGYMWAEGIELLMNLWKHKGKKYRDDDDELTAESVAKEVTIGLVGDMAGIVVGGEEIAELIGNVLTGEKWYGIDTMGMEQLNDFFEGIANAGSGIRDLVTEGGNILDQGGDLGEYFSSHSKDILGGAKDLAEVAATYLGGVPVTNLETYLLGLVKWVSPELNTAYEDALESVNKSDLSGLTGGSLAVRVESVLSDRNIDAGDETAKVLAGLYEAGYKTAIPSNAPTSISIDGEAVQLSAYEQQLYGNIWSNAVSGGLDELTSSQAFANADQKTQAKMLSDLYSYATERAKAGVAEEYEVQSGTAKVTAVSKAVPLAQYMAVRAVANGMESDKDSDGNTITGSKKEKVVAYINDMDDLEYGEKIILYRSLYSGDDSYNGEIVEYLNGREDISYDQMVEILLALGFRISDDGNKVYWD